MGGGHVSVDGNGGAVKAPPKRRTRTRRTKKAPEIDLTQDAKHGAGQD